MAIYVPEEITKEIGKNRYLIKALPAEYGLNVMNTLQALEGNPSAEFMKQLVLRSVTVNNMQPNDEWFNKNFSRNYKELYELFKAIVDFNFGEMGEEDSPNVDSVTSE